MSYANEQRRRPRFEQVPLSAVPILVQKTVLNVCRDRALLQTRTAILESAGFRVVAVSTVGGATQALATDSFDAVVLCHSLSRDERQELIRASRRLSPRIEIVALYNLHPRNDDAIDKLVDAQNSPENLIQALLEGRR